MTMRIPHVVIAAALVLCFGAAYHSGARADGDPSPAELERVRTLYRGVLIHTKASLVHLYGDRVRGAALLGDKDVLICFSLAKYRKKEDLYNSGGPGGDSPFGKKKPMGDPWEKPKRLPSDEEIREKRMEDFMGSINTRDEFIQFAGDAFRSFYFKGFAGLGGRPGTVFTVYHNVDTIVRKADPTRPERTLAVRPPVFVLVGGEKDRRHYPPGTRVVLRLVPGRTVSGEILDSRRKSLAAVTDSPVFEVTGVVEELQVPLP